MRDSGEEADSLQQCVLMGTDPVPGDLTHIDKNTLILFIAAAVGIELRSLCILIALAV